jgi:hypothetical protein
VEEFQLLIGTERKWGGSEKLIVPDKQLATVWVHQVRVSDNFFGVQPLHQEVGQIW